MVYGPVISWRLGRSLGIDVLLPPKACTFDCIYCQLGRTIRRITSPEEFKPRVHLEDVISQVEEALASLDASLLDYITFSGCGEPTLHPELGDMIEAVRGICPQVPIAVLTNASLLWREDVLEGASRADLLVAKLDAPDSTLFRIINRPVEGIDLPLVIQGLKEARRKVRGRLALQSMFLRARGRPLNTAVFVLEKMAEIIEEVKPYQVQVNTPTRPPAESYVQPLQAEEVSAVARALASRLEGVEVISWHPPEEEPLGLRARDLRESVIGVLRRRPCRFHELCSVSGHDPSLVRGLLDRLISDGLVGIRTYRGERFYVLKRA